MMPLWSHALPQGDMALPPVLQGNGGLPQRPGLDDHLLPSLSSNPSTPGGSGALSPDQEKTILIRQQLVLLLHAHKCLQRERESENYRCNLPHCQVMKEVYRHIMQCTRARDCNCESNSYTLNVAPCLAVFDIVLWMLACPCITRWSYLSTHTDSVEGIMHKHV